MTFGTRMNFNVDEFVCVCGCALACACMWWYFRVFHWPGALCVCGLVSQWAPVLCFSLLPSSGNCDCLPPCLSFFMWVLGSSCAHRKHFPSWAIYSVPYLDELDANCLNNVWIHVLFWYIFFLLFDIIHPRGTMKPPSSRHCAQWGSWPQVLFVGLC